MKVRAYACQTKKEGKKQQYVLLKKKTQHTHRLVWWQLWVAMLQRSHKPPSAAWGFTEIQCGWWDVSTCTSFRLLFSGETSLILLRRPPFPLSTHRPASWSEHDRWIAVWRNWSHSPPPATQRSTTTGMIAHVKDVEHRSETSIPPKKKLPVTQKWKL